VNTSPQTTRWGLLAAIGTGIGVLGSALTAGAATVPGAPSWLPVVGLVIGALGGALAATGQALGGAAARDNRVSDEEAGAKEKTAEG
jgi:hypothetical protein